MYYIFTADRLTRTSVWLEKMEGGIDYLKQVIIDDKLGICEELERRMQQLVDTYRCEWKEVVNDPEKRRWFRQFVNTEETESCIELVDERGQRRPADWPKDASPPLQITQSRSHAPRVTNSGSSQSELDTPTNGNGRSKESSRSSRQWVHVGRVSDFPKDGGATIKYGNVQIAVFNFTSRGRWYACQNMCPHKNAFVLSRGILGSAGDEPKVACPLHKRPFSLQTGHCLSGDDYSLKLFPVKVEGDDVYLELPPQSQLDALLATELHCIRDCTKHESEELACAAG
jgi:nitrite reductase (NADH) large subunit